MNYIFFYKYFNVDIYKTFYNKRILFFILCMILTVMDGKTGRKKKYNKGNEILCRPHDRNIWRDES